MAGTGQNFTTPVGRLVAGSLYKGQTQDAEGRPLLIKNGPNAGQPRVDYYFGLAIAKGAEPHWAHTEWGQKIWAVGHAFQPSAGQNPKFAWKVADGDSQIPNANGKKNCDREGWRGHWILHISSGYAPRIFKARAGTNPPTFDPMVEPDAVKLGYYVQVNINADANNSTQQPGVYLNHSMVCFSAFGPEIFVGPDAASAGFGAAPLPAGASMTPPANFNPAATAAGAPPLVPNLPPVPGAPPVPPGAVVPPPVLVPPVPAAAPARVLTPAAGGATYEALLGAGWTDATLIANGLMLPPAAAVPVAPPVVPAVPVVPNPAFVQMPPVPGAPGALPLPPGAPALPVPPVARQMTAKAGGHTYESLIAGGWTDATLVQQGMMLA